MTSCVCIVRLSSRNDAFINERYSDVRLILLVVQIEYCIICHGIYACCGSYQSEDIPIAKISDVVTDGC